MRGIVTQRPPWRFQADDGSGAPFSFRSEIILISFTVILVTLVLQGLSLPPIIRWLRLEEDMHDSKGERLARQHAATAALSRLDQVVVTENWVATRSRSNGCDCAICVGWNSSPGRVWRRMIVPTKVAKLVQRLHHEVLTAERRPDRTSGDNGTISDEVLHQLEQELDVAALHQGRR